MIVGKSRLECDSYEHVSTDSDDDVTIRRGDWWFHRFILRHIHTTTTTSSSRAVALRRPMERSNASFRFSNASTVKFRRTKGAHNELLTLGDRLRELDEATVSLHQENETVDVAFGKENVQIIQAVPLRRICMALTGAVDDLGHRMMIDEDEQNLSNQGIHARLNRAVKDIDLLKEALEREKGARREEFKQLNKTLKDRVNKPKAMKAMKAMKTMKTMKAKKASGSGKPAMQAMKAMKAMETSSTVTRIVMNAIN